MPLYLLNEHEIWFPPVSEALDDGLLAAGGDLRTERLLLAYRSGIFPWFNEDDPPLWWSPDPRCVLFPADIRISKSMQQVIRKGSFEFRTDTDFAAVIRNCRHTPRRDQDGTWITDDVVDAYTTLHTLGYAHSAETWYDGRLVGGLYGIRMGGVFFGESMFSHESNASKFAFIHYVQQLREEGVQLIDCQVHTDHLERMGAKMIPRTEFMQLLEALLPPV
jgi:leucyl/phenylalanyl-tRNA--protein transferase